MYTVTMLDAQAVNTNKTTDPTITEYPQGLNGCKMTCEKSNMALEVISTSNGTTGTVKLQACDSGVSGDFKDVDDSAITLAVAGAYTLNFTNIMKKYYRLVYDKGNGTTGTVTATLTFS